LLLLVLFATALQAQPFDSAKLREVDATIEQAIAGKKLPGGVLWIERNGETVRRVYGNRALEPSIEPVTEGTLYDAASLTKVSATAPSIWRLIERGKVQLDATAKTYLAELADPTITVRHLLTHSSGLRPGLDLRESWSGYDEGIRRALAETPRNRPGAVFRYSDVNYILLGEIVRRVSGEPLDVFARREIFEPLEMRDTGFRPTQTARIAPTERVDGELLRGTVHDPTARRMGGVAGHAGLFTTAADLAKFARAVLAGRFPKAMTEVQSPGGVAIKRAGGFDVDSHYARPRGTHFPVGSFGHTGWTGGFLWIDPQSRTFYIFLSNRVHPDGKGSVVALQRQLGTLVAEAAGLNETVRPRIVWPVGGAGVQNGIDVLHAMDYAPLRGLRVGLITNHTGIDRYGNPTADLLRSAPGVQLVALFSPEHGLRGTVDDKLGDEVDSLTKLPVYSLYGERRKPSREQLANLDALVFDIQDIGTRFYTYISTMGLAMEAAAEAKIRFIVLDRVNPIGGDLVEGPLLEGKPDFVAWHRLPIRHGMTAGELAKMFNAERRIGAELTVIPLRGWSRTMWQDEAGLPWIDTSPNMRSLSAAGLYPGIGLLERAISVGRGTPTPFEILGAPYIDGAALIREVGPIPGLTLTPVRFTPTASIHKGEECGGVRIAITDRKALRAVDAGLLIGAALARLYPGKFPVDELQPLLRHGTTLERVRAGSAGATDTPREFERRRARHLLYGNSTVIHNVTLIDGTAAAPRRGVDLVLRGAWIERIDDAHNHGDAKVVDATGRYVIPGLIDMHAHLLLHPWDEKGGISPRGDRPTMLAMLRLLIEHGVTSVRDPGSETEAAVALRGMLERGEVEGPRLFTAGRMLNASNFDPEPFAPVFDEQQVRDEIRWQAAAGVDTIKLYSSMTPALAAVAIEEAHAHGLPVIGHVQRTSWSEAARLGIDGLEHPAPWTTDLVSDCPPDLRGRICWLEKLDLQSPAVTELARLLAEKKVAVDPTLMAMHTKFWGDDARYTHHPELERVPPKLRTGWPAGRFTAEWTAADYARAQSAWPKLLGFTKLLFDRGVLLTAGTDMPTPWTIPGISLHEELQLLHSAGIPPADVLRMATANAARVLRRDDLGVLAAGKRADFVLLSRDPLADLANTRAIEQVFKDGQRVR
jgi:uncharacterized protein YbbC (DUF1343 family)/imidazolonepropionase-like amidohydrolase